MVEIEQINWKEEATGNGQQLQLSASCKCSSVGSRWTGGLRMPDAANPLSGHAIR